MSFLVQGSVVVSCPRNTEDLWSYICISIVRAIPFEKLGGGCPRPVKNSAGVWSGQLANSAGGKTNFFGNSGGGWYGRNPPNILWGGQISLNPYFSRDFTHIYI